MTVQETPDDATETPAADSTGGLLKSSAVMAAGTVVSRLTGFLRVTVIMAALGSSPLSNAYNTANNAPYSLYELLLGGVLSAVLVPTFVRANKRSEREGNLYAQRLLTLVVLVLIVLTAASIVGAPLILEVIASQMAGDQREIAIAFLRFLLPQILFLGVGAVLNAILQSRRRFAAPMWAPVLNNVTVIAVGVLFAYVVEGQPTPGTITDGETMLLGFGTSAGILVQVIALVPSLLRAGFRPRPRFGFRQLGLGQIGRMGLWTIVYVVTNLAQLFVVTNIGSAVDSALRDNALDVNYGYTPYQNAFVVFQLPHAIVAVSVITALLPRMSSHAAEGKLAHVRDDLSTGIRLAAVLIIPAAAALIALGEPVGLTIFGHGNYTAVNASYTGMVIAAFALGIVPFSVFQLLLRVFYALQDTRTPALINLFGTVITIAVGIACWQLLPYQYVMISLALAYGVGYLVNTVVAARVLSRRLDGVNGRVVLGALARMAVAVAPGTAVAWLASLSIMRVMGEGTTTAIVAVVVGGLIVLGCFVILARVLRVTEVRTLVGTFRGRLGRDG